MSADLLQIILTQLVGFSVALLWCAYAMTKRPLSLLLAVFATTNFLVCLAQVSS